MEKRAIFGSKMLPYLLLGPQLLVTLVFFYWPASQAVWQSFLLQDAFGLRTDFIWLENYRDLFRQPVPDASLQAIRDATQFEWALGNRAFREKAEALTGRRAARRAKGRPRKKSGREEIVADPIFAESRL